MATTHDYKPKSAWQTYSSREDRLKLAEFARGYTEFLSKCKTERETVAWAMQLFGDAGDNTDLIVRPFREKALFVAKKGQEPVSKGFRLIAAHGDSPRLDFKQHPFLEKGGIALGRTHFYGGIRKYQWLARPLALHGVVILANGEKISVCIGEDVQEPVFCVLDLLPHLAKEQQKKTLADAFDGEKLKVVLGHEPIVKEDEKESECPARDQLLEILHTRYGICEEDFITAELEVVPAGRARFVGLDQSLVGGYGQDDRICVFTSISAFLHTESPQNNIAVMIWDKEEIGSEGATGASSQFLRYCLEDAAKQWGDCPVSDVLLNTDAISADVTGALDPDYEDVHEKDNAARMGFGPCFSKYTGSGGKYNASDADAEYFAECRTILNNAGIPWQAAELGKVGAGGGGTVALFLAALGMRVIDLGPALLSMHSPFEIASVADIYATFRAYQTFLQK